ncbi:hypothetical protein VI817_004198 [Penicillium citrinum]|nr:hypothetical protein VI817_004198 [Penicillium citrinum]
MGLAVGAQTLRQAGANQGSRDPRACQMHLDVIPVLRGISVDTLEIRTVQIPIATMKGKILISMGLSDQ